MPLNDDEYERFMETAGKVADAIQSGQGLQKDMALKSAVWGVAESRIGKPLCDSSPDDLAKACFDIVCEALLLARTDGVEEHVFNQVAEWQRSRKKEN